MILLIVLLLLTLLSLLMLTLLMVTAQGRLSAKAASRAKPADPANKLLQEAFFQVVRGSTDSDSVMGAHSLLEDLYGNVGMTGTVQAAPTPQAGGAVCELSVTMTWTSPSPQPSSGFYDGRVLTMLSGEAKGQSTRVLSSTYDASTLITSLRIVALEGRQTPRITTVGAGNLSNLVLPQAGDSILINGRPFSGTGFGLNPLSLSDLTKPPLNALDPTFLQVQALQPNHAAFVMSATYADPAGPGGANEDYDAPDFQNMLLALRQPSSTGVTTKLPSLHRPELVQYWQNAASGLWQNNSAFRRRVVLRPSSDDHPNFTGGNPAFDPSSLTGPWDVDNDNDGSPDSIWVDLGVPVLSDRRGKHYKPLFAVLCVDLDGRLNLNAHGNLNHLDDGRSSYVFGPFAWTPQDSQQAGSAPPTQYQKQLSCGQGYGPAEINLYKAGDTFSGEKAELTALLVGDATRGINGRYGEINRTSIAGSPQPTWRYPGWTREEDLLNRLRQFELIDASQAYFSFITPNDFGTPPDVDDDGQMALDLRGQPYYWNYSATAGWGEVGERLDDPYEMNLSRNVAGALRADGVNNNNLPIYAAIDAQFTPVELSALLRFGDVDAAKFPSRLADLAPNTFVSGAYALRNRHRFTTESWDVPTPSFVATAPDVLASLYGLLGPSARITDLSLTEILRARMKADGYAPLNSPPGAFSPDAFDKQAQLLLAPEMRAGLRLDLNRPLGNGRDDLVNGLKNGVVDEPGEAQVDTAWTDVYGANSPVAFDLNNDGQINAADSLARQDFARHLYVLMMLVKDQSFTTQYDVNSLEDAEQQTARAIAQWAVNVVDFRDRDSIMTPFAYDIHPFDVDGWSPNAIVWGCERPQVLITETLAFHDRATEDLDNPAGQAAGAPSTSTLFQQRYLPEGSLFVELFNPWSANDGPPGEFEAVPPAVVRGAIDLTRRDETGTSPVWRMLVTASVSSDPATDWQFQSAPDDWALQTPTGAYIERGIYFVVPTDPNITDDGLVKHFNSAYAAPLPPNQYAVVGPGASVPNPTIASQATYVGRLISGGTQNNRRIVMTPALPPPSPFVVPPAYSVPGQVGVYDNIAAGDNSPVNITDVKPAVAIVVDQAVNPMAAAGAPPTPQVRRLSVSEPVKGYDTTGYNFTSGFNPPKSTPLDWTQTRTYLCNADKQAVLTTGITTPFLQAVNPQSPDQRQAVPYRMIHLQRLANPLMPYDPATNPYRTIDSMPIDLLSFTGRSQNQVDTPIAKTNNGSAVIAFASRQRGDFDAWTQAQPSTSTQSQVTPSIPSPATVRAGWPLNRLWPQEPALKSVIPNSLGDGGSNYFFPYVTQQTLGYLNSSYYWSFPAYYKDDGSGYTQDWSKSPSVKRTPTSTAQSGTFWRSADLAPTGNPLIPPSDYAGDPKTAFPWFTWNNRPYVGPIELMLVPAWSSSRLLAHFSLRDPTINPYSPLAPTYYGSYHQQLNLFHAAPLSSPVMAPNYYRFLEYVTVPSRFIATDVYELPTLFESGLGTDDLHPPFNHISTYREPGRLNLNTMVESAPWQALLDGLPDNGYWQQLAKNRGGYSGAETFAANSSFPTLFVNPFRSSSGSRLVPLANMLPNSEIAATLLRSDAFSLANPFNPLFSSTLTDGYAYMDTDRNPYFRYQVLSKMANLTTTRSNVYAVWITMGYFDVESVPIDDAHPDGYTLGAEHTDASGATRRHRAFYLYDRTVPVGFQRGSNLNAGNGILLEQFIE